MISYASMTFPQLVYIFFCISASFPKKETHGRYISSFSLLPSPRGEGVTFLIRDTRERNRISVCGSQGGMALGSPFKKEVASQLQ